jgi:hypothetical protein
MKQILIKPNEAGKFIHTPLGLVWIARLFPSSELRPDQLREEPRHEKTSLRKSGLAVKAFNRRG